MNRLFATLVATTLVIGCISAPALAQDDLQATIDALETRVSDLEGPVAEGTPALSNDGDAQFPGVYGAVPPNLPKAPQGEVAVVVEGAFSPYSDDYRTVILHNNSSDAVQIGDVKGIVESKDGSLAGASTGSYFIVSELPAGAYTIGFVVFGSDIGDSETVDYEVSLSDDQEDPGSFEVALSIDRLSQQESTFVGEVVNDHELAVELEIVRVYCLNKDGVPYDTETAWFSSETLKPGDSLIFETDDIGSDLQNDCPYYLAVAVGLDWEQ